MTLKRELQGYEAWLKKILNDLKDPETPDPDRSYLRIQAQIYGVKIDTLKRRIAEEEGGV